MKLLDKHFTPGRGGNKIDKVVIHHNAGVLSIDQIWQVWQSRAASAHYQVETGGRIGQLVWDCDTAWHAANAWINQTSIGIEFANSAGANSNHHHHRPRPQDYQPVFQLERLRRMSVRARPHQSLSGSTLRKTRANSVSESRNCSGVITPYSVSANGVL